MTSKGRRDALMLVAGVGLGAGLMYFCDPRSGAERRGGARRALQRVGRHRSSDELVAARVRTVVARSVSHPAAIAVTVEQGRVTLGGSVIAREVDALLRRVRRVHGVIAVRSEMDAHDWAADVPGLQGIAERPRRLPGLEEMGWRWPAGAGIVGGTALGALAVRGVRALR